MAILCGKGALVEDGDHCCLGKERGDHQSFSSVHTCPAASSAPWASSVIQKQDWSLEAAPHWRDLYVGQLAGVQQGFPWL